MLRSSIGAFRDAGVKVVPLRLSKVIWSPRVFSQLARLIRDERVDVVHVHSQEAGIPGRLMARIAGVRRVIYTPQTIDVRRSRWRPLYVLVERSLSSITDVIISVNESDRRRLLQWGIPSRKVATVVNGIDLAEFTISVERQQMLREWGLDEARPLVLQVARLRTQKNPLAFVDGAAEVLRTCPETQFALAGDGPLRDRLTERVRELDLQRSIRILGWVDEAARLMAVADVVTLTSSWEGMPYTLLEAMGWSRPVVATAVNGCPEVVVDGVTGLLVPAGDTSAWAEAVARVLADPETAKTMGLQGRRRLEERFSLQTMVGRIEALYDS
jgi:glycosyltransferase involved in cell wall biosynthesis